MGDLRALLSGALAGLNLRVVPGKSFTFEKLRLARTERLALMIRSWLLHRAHADASLLSFFAVDHGRDSGHQYAKNASGIHSSGN